MLTITHKARTRLGWPLFIVDPVFHHTHHTIALQATTLLVI